MIKELMYKWFKLEPFPCQSCETLKLQLSIANHEKDELLRTILSFSKPPEQAPAQPIDYEKVKPKLMTWNVRKHMLEAEDRAAAALLAEQQKKSIENLEKEVGIKEEVKNAQA